MSYKGTSIGQSPIDLRLSSGGTSPALLTRRFAKTMKTFYTDKGQCIIGYEIIEVSNFQKKFIDVDQFIIQLTNLKTEFSMETKIFERNFRHVILEHMEDEPETANFPEPYIIEHN
jgi:hypothetical protein